MHRWSLSRAALALLLVAAAPGAAAPAAATAPPSLGELRQLLKDLGTQLSWTAEYTAERATSREGPPGGDAGRAVARVVRGATRGHLAAYALNEFLLVPASRPDDPRGPKLFTILGESSRMVLAALHELKQSFPELVDRELQAAVQRQVVMQRRLGQVRLGRD